MWYNIIVIMIIKVPFGTKLVSVREVIPMAVRKDGHIHGGLAQLEERLLCTQKVIGSTPISSTSCLQEVSDYTHKILTAGKDRRPYAPLAQRQSARLVSVRSRYHNSHGAPSPFLFL